MFVRFAYILFALLFEHHVIRLPGWLENAFIVGFTTWLIVQRCRGRGRTFTKLSDGVFYAVILGLIIGGVVYTVPSKWPTYSRSLQMEVAGMLACLFVICSFICIDLFRYFRTAGRPKPALAATSTPGD